MDPIKEYINKFPVTTQDILNKIRNVVLKTCPESEEYFSYGMPGYKLNKKPLIYFAAYKNHIGIYATPSCHTKFKKELSGYKHGKGSVQFPLTDKIPYSLIEKIVKFKKKEIIGKVKKNLKPRKKGS